MKGKPVFNGGKLLPPNIIMTKLTANIFDLNKLLTNYFGQGKGKAKYKIISDDIIEFGFSQNVLNALATDNSLQKQVATYELIVAIIQNAPQNESMKPNDAYPMFYYKTLALIQEIQTIGKDVIVAQNKHWKSPKQKQLDYACAHNQGTTQWVKDHCIDGRPKN